MILVSGINFFGREIRVGLLDLDLDPESTRIEILANNKCSIATRKAGGLLKAIVPLEYTTQPVTIVMIDDTNNNSAILSDATLALNVNMATMA